MPAKTRTIINKGWEWLPVRVVGDDLIVDQSLATWFGDGGRNDTQDGGDTASGYPTRGHPDLLGVSLPMLYRGRDKRVERMMAGCPIPMLPYGITSKGKLKPDGTQVIVTAGKKVEAFPAIDLGPDPATRHGIDLTQAAFRKMGGDLDEGVMLVSFRIVGGAKFLAA